ncbi:recQ-mediated genome instability protein 1-like [Ornithodoros turicata]|uniref:recQ-mediated genome instability protein 1-like n=1 Tax=Ornithodoros turicata TaxID=34597 RepID=UPI003138C21C
MSLVRLLEQHLLRQHIKVRVEWLEACVAFLRNENPGRSIRNEEIHGLVFEQLLHTDINGVAVASFPSLTESKMTLQDYYFVQMEEVRDISQPAYSQLKKLTGTENVNCTVQAEPQETPMHWETKLTRMLKMVLSDGVNKVNAFEYEVIPALNLSLPPGTKLIISGPLECRKKVLFLTSRNVRVLGGCVESLASNNTQQSILGSVLQSQSVQGDALQEMQTANTTSFTGTRTINPRMASNSVSPQGTGNRTPTPRTSSHTNNVSPKRKVSTLAPSEAILIEDSLDRMDEDDALLGQLDLDDYVFPEEDDIDEDMLREQLEFQANAEPMQADSPEQSPSPPSPYVTLKTVVEKNMKSTPQTVLVKGCYISGVTSKVKLNLDLTWKLSLKLSDDTDCLEVDMESDLIVSLMGVSGGDYRRLTKECRDEKLKEFKEKLRDMEGVMHIRFSEDGDQLPKLVLYEEETKT